MKNNSLFIKDKEKEEDSSQLGLISLNSTKEKSKKQFQFGFSLEESKSLKVNASSKNVIKLKFADSPQKEREKKDKVKMKLNSLLPIKSNSSITSPSKENIMTTENENFADGILSKTDNKSQKTLNAVMKEIQTEIKRKKNKNQSSKNQIETNQKANEKKHRRSSVMHKVKVNREDDSNHTREEVLYDFIDEMNKKTEYYSILMKIRYSDILISILMIVNIILSILDNEIYIKKTNDFLVEKMNNENITLISKEVLEEIGEREISSSENIIRYIEGVIILISLVLIYLTYYFKIQIYKLSGFLSKNDGIFSSGEWKFLLIEFLVCAIYLPPNVNFVLVGKYIGYFWSYHINSMVSLLVIVKLFFVMRIINETSRWTSDTSKLICRKYNVRTGVAFAIKCEFKERPFILLSIIFLLVLTITSFILRTFEFGVKLDTDTTFIGNNSLQNLLNCFHFISFSMTTVGYGDIVPHSILGRCIAIISCIIGNLIIGLIIASLAVISEFTNGERKAYSIIKKLSADDNAMKKAALVIHTILQLRKSGERKENITVSQNFQTSILHKRFVTIAQLKMQIHNFKNDFKIAVSHHLPIDEHFRILDTTITSNAMRLLHNFSLLNSSDLDLHEVVEQIKESKPKLKEVVSMQKKISNYVVQLNSKGFERIKQRIQLTSQNDIIAPEEKIKENDMEKFNSEVEEDNINNLILNSNSNESKSKSKNPNKENIKITENEETREIQLVKNKKKSNFKLVINKIME